MASTPGTPEQPLRVAVVGSGPSGFYAAGHVLKVKGLRAEVDLYDRLPTPFGLVRAGVAPDHPKIKSVTRVYERTAANPGFRFFGYVTVGRDISHAELKERYHAVIYAVGAETDRRMGIPGEDLAGSWAASELVAWYNAHPDFSDLDFDLSHRRAVVIGNGNVAMDVARMLVFPREELDVTDTADHAIDALAGNGIEEVVIVGRRGSAQAAFTNPELLELGELTDADVVVDRAEMHEQSERSIEGEGDMTAGELGLERDEFQWMKMAAIGGPLFYEGQFLRIQKAIFSDLAWQHEAFVLGGAAAIRRAVDKLPAGERERVLPTKTRRAWEDIESIDPKRVAAGNFKLIEREQGPVIQPRYDDMSDRTGGGLVTGQLTNRADTPIEGSETYREYSNEGNIANYPDRIRWIRDSLWPAHQQQLAEPHRVEDILARDFDSQVDRYRQVTPGALGNDALDFGVDVGEEVLDHIMPGPRLQLG